MMSTNSKLTLWLIVLAIVCLLAILAKASGASDWTYAYGITALVCCGGFIWTLVRHE